jgi:signal transduction histidine kinase
MCFGIDLTTWISSQVESFITRTQQQQQSLILRLPANLPPFTTDTSHLQRIVQELLHNACKYTPPGETIRIAASALTAQNLMELKIANSGVSLSALECDRIFDRFYRIPNNDPWKHGGTGLGLALVKKLVEYMQGTIWAESKAKHLQFVIRLPLQLEPRSPQ